MAPTTRSKAPTAKAPSAQSTRRRGVSVSGPTRNVPSRQSKRNLVENKSSSSVKRAKRETETDTSAAAAPLQVKLESQEDDEYKYSTDDEHVDNKVIGNIPVKSEESGFEIDDELDGATVQTGQIPFSTANDPIGNYQTSLVDLSKLKIDDRVLVCDSKGTWRATFKRLKIKDQEPGIVVHYDGLKPNSRRWICQERVVGLIVGWRVKRAIQQKLDISVIDFSNLGINSKVVLEKGIATITSFEEDEIGVKRFMVSENSNAIVPYYVPRANIFDVIMEVGPSNPVEDVIKEYENSGNDIEFGRLGVGSYVHVMSEGGIACPAQVMGTCLQGAIVEFKHDDDGFVTEGKKFCWVPWNRILHICHEKYEEKKRAIQEKGEKILRLLLKREYISASEIYKKVYTNEGEPPKLWVNEVAR